MQYFLLANCSLHVHVVSMTVPSRFVDHFKLISFSIIHDAVLAPTPIIWPKLSPWLYNNPYSKLSL